MPPEQLDELVDVDPLRLRDVAVALLAERDEARAERDSVQAAVAPDLLAEMIWTASKLAYGYTDAGPLARTGKENQKLYRRQAVELAELLDLERSEGTRQASRTETPALARQEVGTIAWLRRQLRQAEAEREAARAARLTADKTLAEQIDRAIEAEAERDAARAAVEQVLTDTETVVARLRAAEAERDTARDQVQRIRDRHPRKTDDADCTDADTTFGCQHAPGYHAVEYCESCDEAWPCAEIAALDDTSPDPRRIALEELADRYSHAFEVLFADARARATRKETDHG